MDDKIVSGIRIAKNTAIAAGVVNIGAAFFSSPFFITDAVLFLGCAYGIANKSRFCAMAAFSLAISTALYKLLDTLNVLAESYLYDDWMPYAYFASTVGYLICSILLYKGIWATIVYHDRYDTIVPRQPLDEMEQENG